MIEGTKPIWKYSDNGKDTSYEEDDRREISLNPIKRKNSTEMLQSINFTNIFRNNSGPQTILLSHWRNMSRLSYHLW